jgi:hypothetical protein
MLSILIGPILVVAAGAYLWFAFGRPTIPTFLVDFAKLLDRTELVDSLAYRVSRRSVLKGEFRGRKIVVLLKQVDGETCEYNLAVSMETHAIGAMDSDSFADYRPDRETELALYALEVTHSLRLRHDDGCLKAQWARTPSGYPFVGFTARCDPAKWRRVLEQMETLAGSLERRANTHSERSATSGSTRVARRAGT